jgi:hypothetical protein
MYSLLSLYERPYNPLKPVVCLDEMSKQLLDHKRPPIPLTSHHGIREDTEYIRNGTRNLFVAVEPKGKKRFIKVTEHRTKQDFANVVKDLVDIEYATATCLQLVVDNLNTHFPSSFYETFEPDEAKRILDKIDFHYTPIHGSWLNAAEIEIRILNGQCLDRRIPDENFLKKEVDTWMNDRNAKRKGIDWKFDRKKAAEKFKLLTNQN